jgi:hypothetical protein
MRRIDPPADPRAFNPAANQIEIALRQPEFFVNGARFEQGKDSGRGKT